ncbi:MAG: glycosyltransferase family 4 protein [bacterium]
MKILYLHQYFMTNRSAGGTRSFEIIKYLTEKGHNVELITGLSADDKHPIKNLTIHSTDTEYSNSMSYTRRLLSFMHFIIKSIKIGIRIKEFDIVFATSTPLTIAIPAIIISRWRRRPFVFEVRDVWPDIPIGLGILTNPLLVIIARLTEHIVYGKASHIIALSTGMRENIIGKGVPGSKISVVTNMSNIDLFSEAESIRQRIDEELSTAGKTICIYAGTLGYANNVDYILESAKKSAELGSSVHYIIAGEGRQRPELTAKAQRENIENVTFIPSIAKEDVVSYIKSSDIGLSVFLNNSVLFDNSANKFFDYLAAGKPVLINYGGWQNDVIENALCGYICDGDNPADMAERIDYLSSNPDLIEEMSQRSLRLGKERFSRNNAVRHIESILRRAID